MSDEFDIIDGFDEDDPIDLKALAKEFESDDGRSYVPTKPLIPDNITINVDGPLLGRSQRNVPLTATEVSLHIGSQSYVGSWEATDSSPTGANWQQRRIINSEGQQTMSLRNIESPTPLTLERFNQAVRGLADHSSYVVTPGQEVYAGQFVDDSSVRSPDIDTMERLLRYLSTINLIEIKEIGTSNPNERVIKLTLEDRIGSHSELEDHNGQEG